MSPNVKSDTDINIYITFERNSDTDTDVSVTIVIMTLTLVKLPIAVFPSNYDTLTLFWPTCDAWGLFHKSTGN